MKTTAEKFNKRLRPVLKRHSLVSEEVIQEALEGNEDGESLTTLLLESGKLDEGDFLAALSKETGVPPIDVRKVKASSDLLELVPEHHAKYYGVIPVSRVGGILTIAVYNPYDILKLDDIAMVTSCTIKPVLSTDHAIHSTIANLYDRGSQVMKELLDGMVEPELELQDQRDDDEDLSDIDSGDESPVVKLINLIIVQGIRERASDIHIEPCERYVRVRYRFDGVLQERMQPPAKMLNSLVSRIKIMCGLDIAERRVPQDGKFQIRVQGRQVDFRVSTLPMVHGEKVVLRILDSSNLALDLETLGFEEEALKDIRDSINMPYGMLLVTGPTGSGKSTTLYSCINEVMTSQENIVTVEDPVEYQLEGINQVPVNAKRGLTFAAALRAILRQDPDTVMIGEIRDLETVEIAIKAALTGHLVFSTLHTNDAPSTITRMVDMGVDPFLVASATQCIAAQRLARRLCEECKKPMENPPPPERLLSLGFEESDLEGLQLFVANGCPRCSGGYKGRFALLETVIVNDEIARIVVSGGSALDIKEAALKLGMVTLRRCGIMNVTRGKTSIEEVLRVTMTD